MADESVPAALLTRRGFQAGIAVLALAPGWRGVHADAATACARTVLAYIGTEGGTYRALRLDVCAGTLTPLGAVAEVPKARWAVAHPSLPVLYVARDGGGQEGCVAAYAVDRASGALSLINQVGSGGAGATHLCLDAPSMTLLVANFGAGSVSSIAVDRDGRLGALVSTLQATGSGPHRRQASAHAHGAGVDPSGRYVLVPDLGADRVFVYGLDRASHALRPDLAADPHSYAVPAGSGPHHLVFGSDGRHAYLLNELSAEVMTLRWDAAGGRLAPVQTLQITSPEFQGVRSGSEIVVGADGSHVYVGNRGENALAVYRVDAEAGTLALVQRAASGGEAPWTLALDPSGACLLVANQRANRVNLFRVDRASGRVSDSGQAAEVPAPLSVAFVGGEV